MAEAKTGLTESMRAIEAAVAKKRDEEENTLYGLVKYFQRRSILRNIFPTESTPLNPMVTAEKPQCAAPGKQARVHVLLVRVPAHLKPEKLSNPIGYLCWEWPSRRLVAIMLLGPEVGFTDTSVSPSDFLNKHFVDSVEGALKEGSVIPRPSPALSGLYKALLEKPGLPLWEGLPLPELAAINFKRPPNTENLPTFVPPEIPTPPLSPEPGSSLGSQPGSPTPLPGGPDTPSTNRFSGFFSSPQVGHPASSQPALTPQSFSPPKAPEVNTVAHEMQNSLETAFRMVREVREKQDRQGLKTGLAEGTDDLLDLTTNLK